LAADAKTYNQLKNIIKKNAKDEKTLKEITDYNQKLQ